MDLPTIRASQGWTRAELARRLDVSPPMISLIEGGQRALPPRRAEQIAEILSVPAAERPAFVGALILAHRGAR